MTNNKKAPAKSTKQLEWGIASYMTFRPELKIMRCITQNAPS